MTTEILCFWWDEAYFQPIRSTSQMWLLVRHQCEISALVPPMSFCRKTSGGFAKYQLFSEAKEILVFALQLFTGHPGYHVYRAKFGLHTIFS